MRIECCRLVEGAQSGMLFALVPLNQQLVVDSRLGTQDARPQRLQQCRTHVSTDDALLKPQLGVPRDGLGCMT